MFNERPLKRFDAQNLMGCCASLSGRVMCGWPARLLDFIRLSDG